MTTGGIAGLLVILVLVAIRLVRWRWRSPPTPAIDERESEREAINQNWFDEVDAWVEEVRRELRNDPLRSVPVPADRLRHARVAVRRELLAWNEPNESVRLL